MFKKLLVLSIAAVGMSFSYAQEAPAAEGTPAKAECKCGKDDCKCAQKKDCKKCCKKAKACKVSKGECPKEAAAPKAE